MTRDETDMTSRPSQNGVPAISKVRWSGATSLAVATLALAWFALPASAQVTTRLVTAGGSATTAKVVPGGSTSIDVRVDAPATQTIGASFRLSQTAPGASGYVSITARSFAGSIYDDATSGTPDGTVLAAGSALLDPDNDDNLGRSTTGLVGAAAGSNLMVVNLGLTAGASTPLGTYTIRPTSGVSFVTGTGPSFTDYDMSAASFDLVVGQTLAVTKSGTGSGTVLADSGAINCGATCADIYPGSVVNLSAAPVAGHFFAGWSGDCSGVGACQVTVNAARTVNAQFELAPAYSLAVTRTGTGAGTVTGTPAGIACGVTCAVAFPQNTVITLSAVPDPGQTFTGWTGSGCSGTGSCVVTVTGAMAVSAGFARAGQASQVVSVPTLGETALLLLALLLAGVAMRQLAGRRR